MDANAKSYYNAVAQLPQEVASVLYRVPEVMAAAVTEVRLRSGRPVVLSTAGGSVLVRNDGSPTSERTGTLLCTSHSMLEACFHAVCAYSVHSYQGCIAQGFVPLSGGHRAGICGTAVWMENGGQTLKNITSINMRIARMALLHCDARITEILLQHKNGFILAGEPGSGKTTVLRAILFALSAQGVKTAVVDERFEIAPVEQSGFALEMPLHCDVLSGYPKSVGMLQALRSLAPDVLLCDEIGSFDDVHAIEQAANAGVRMIVTLHGGNLQALRQRPQARAVLETGAFDFAVFLRGKGTPGEVREVLKLASDC
ncbi:MAG: ATPase, T2SS/T4P/T4SS family [Ruthenibacterium sp.]